MMTPSQTIAKGPAIVTGAGGGLGRALARKLAQAGVPTAALGRNLQDLQETAGDLPIMPMLCDISKPDEVQRAINGVASRLGTPRILINNAAVYPKRDLLACSAQQFEATLRVNLGGVVTASRAVLNHMAQDGIGRIVNVATFADISPLPMSAEYSVSKGAARIYTRALIADIADRFPDIIVGDWMPGMLATRMGIADGLDPETSAGWGAALALWHDRSLTGTTFEMDREILQGSVLKRRVKSLLTMRKPAKARVITPI
ncbi:MAG: SDR family oxidoreductase [Pseudomonadota bacterium]